MSQEQIRICGYRKVHGVYIVGSLGSATCDRLPMPIARCPVCSSGIKFSRGVQYLNFTKYAGSHFKNVMNEDISCKDGVGCPICSPNVFKQPYSLLWVGQEYTPRSFINEALKLGVSKRVPAKPRKMKAGDIVLLSHNDTMNGINFVNNYELNDDEDDNNDNGNTTAPKNHPGIFAAFVVSAIEKLIWVSEADEDTLKKMEGQGITPVIIKDGDSDHNPEVSNDFTPEERAYKELEDLKRKLLAH